MRVVYAAGIALVAQQRSYVRHDGMRDFTVQSDMFHCVSNVECQNTCLRASKLALPESTARLSSQLLAQPCLKAAASFSSHGISVPYLKLGAGLQCTAFSPPNSALTA